jgi:hypothetical protein
MTMTLSHFSAAVVFALFASIVFGITQKNTKPEMVRYGIQSFIFFVVGTILAGWAMAALRYFAIKN